eukprot:TRINITY_DN7149_c0_g1_i1.p1 TRINITY_DN7149_c0_g1~~TRINITY_DN7149_c0_g1_i1.p1  ORF type:complete len:153 (-),score=15.05 TRINITY_DN7149_c0_g1_i1:596-1054(-)
MTIKIVAQVIEEAFLLTDNHNEWVRSGKGIIVYVAFLKQANKELFESIIVQISNMRICWDPVQQSKVSVSEAGLDVLIVPQASLGGKLKSSRPQYHSLIDKVTGAELYEDFVDQWRNYIQANGGNVYNGTYSNRQGLRITSQGPNTHAFEFN